jgi:glycosyltransferase involved in cell wall biosynthesis
MLGLVRFLPQLGWQPVVVAPPRVPWEPEDVSLLAQIPDGTPVERVPFASGFFGKVARYLAPEGHWLVAARSACLRMIREHQPEAIITSSPPGCVHVLGMRLSGRFGLPWIADFRDPWIANRTPADIAKARRCEPWLERRAMAQASVLVANTPLNQELWTQTFPQHAHKMVTITNGFDPERFAPVAESTQSSETITILHAGELYYGRDPRPLLDALKRTRDAGTRLPVQVEFVGRATEGLFDLPAEIQSRGLEDQVKTAGQIPYAEAIARMQRAGVLLLIQSPGYKVGVPAKLYEYLGAGRPIFALAEPDGDVAWVLRESKVLHRLAPPLDVEKIKQALVELTGDIQSGHPAAPDPAALRQFTRARMAERFAECLERATRRTEPHASV